MVSMLLASPSLATVTRAYRTGFQSSFTGPQFWHDGLMLLREEFRLCSQSSLSGMVGRGINRS